MYKGLSLCFMCSDQYVKYRMPRGFPLTSSLLLPCFAWRQHDHRSHRGRRDRGHHAVRKPSAVDGLARAGTLGAFQWQYNAARAVNKDGQRLGAHNARRGRLVLPPPTKGRLSVSEAFSTSAATHQGHRLESPDPSLQAVSRTEPDGQTATPRPGRHRPRTCWVRMGYCTADAPQGLTITNRPPVQSAGGGGH